MIQVNADPCFDRSAFEEQYDLHHSLVYTIALRLLGNHFEAEDVAQETFLRVWANPCAFRGGNFAAWIARLARNCAIDFLRKRRPALVAHLPQNASPLGNTLQFNLEDQVVQRELSRDLARAMRRLKAHEGRPLVAAFVEELTHQEIARVLKVPLGTVKTRIRAGMRKMRTSSVHFA